MDLRTIQGGGGGAGGACVRAVLRVLSWGWALGAGARSALFALGIRRSARLDVPVISVGNIAVGGTGKTPLVAWLAQRLLAAGYHPGVLARGYAGPAQGHALNDEGLVLAHMLGEDVPQEQQPDRVRGGRALRARHPDVDVILLDDGFQHRRLARDLDIVLLDAMEPFGFGYLLPRGRLRERPEALGRAGAAVVTRTERVTASSAEVTIERVRALVAGPVASARTQVGAGLADELGGARVFAVCGIGNPAAFFGTLADLGVEVVGRRVLRDHQVMPESSWSDILAEAHELDAECVVTTRKDAVKYEHLPAEVVVVDVETVIVGGEDALWETVLAVLNGVRPKSIGSNR